MFPAGRYQKAYQDKPKFRCVGAHLFDFDEAENQKVTELQNLNFSRDEIECLCDLRPPPRDDNERMLRLIAWTFRERSRYPAHRYNTSDFPALYSAREASTAIREFQNSARPRSPDRDLPFVVFEITFSGVLVDLRSAHTEENLGSQTDARLLEIAIEIRNMSYDGLVSPSTDGHTESPCCAIFSRDGITPRRVVLRGESLMAWQPQPGEL